MAQRTEKEETEFKVPDPLTLCVNNCSNTTNTICQNCFNASTTTPSSSPPSAAAFLKFSAGEKAPRSSRRSDGSRSVKPLPVRTEPDSTLASSRREINRCSGCRRKVGLTGFRCRCGDMFCAEHRYSDRHVCSYDYKTAGRNAIARENPVVKAAKILKV